jgi:hypothetical protein
MPQFRYAFALLALITSTSVAKAQGSSTSATPLHLPTNRFEFVASGDTLPAPQPLRIHNGGTAQFTDVRVTRLVYADSARGAGWLVALPRQTAVSPDELATVGMLCIDATRLPAGTYRATADVAAREVPEPVAIPITLIVKDARARAGHAEGHCGIPVTK